jgi:hypothetical protein
VKHRVGKCPACGERVRLVDAEHVYGPRRLGQPASGRVVRWHQVERRIEDRNGDYTDHPACEGIYMRPAADAQLDRQRARAAKPRTQLVDPFRGHAGVALDAMLENRDYPREDIAILIEVAVRSRSLYVDDRTTTISILRFRCAPNRRMRGDLYCSFCGALCVRDVKKGFAEQWSAFLKRHALRNHHAIVCALKHLTFGIPPADPDLRKLPEEYVVAETSP